MAAAPESPSVAVATAEDQKKAVAPTATEDRKETTVEAVAAADHKEAVSAAEEQEKEEDFTFITCGAVQNLWLPGVVGSQPSARLKELQNGDTLNHMALLSKAIKRDHTLFCSEQCADEIGRIVKEQCETTETMKQYCQGKMPVPAGWTMSTRAVLPGRETKRWKCHRCNYSVILSREESIGVFFLPLIPLTRSRWSRNQTAVCSSCMHALCKTAMTRLSAAMSRWTAATENMMPVGWQMSVAPHNEAVSNLLMGRKYKRCDSYKMAHSSGQNCLQPETVDETHELVFVQKHRNKPLILCAVCMEDLDFQNRQRPARYCSLTFSSCRETMVTAENEGKLVEPYIATLASIPEPLVNIIEQYLAAEYGSKWSYVVTPVLGTE